MLGRKIKFNCRKRFETRKQNFAHYPKSREREREGEEFTLHKYVLNFCLDKKNIILDNCQNIISTFSKYIVFFLHKDMMLSISQMPSNTEYEVFMIIQELFVRYYLGRMCTSYTSVIKHVQLKHLKLR